MSKVSFDPEHHRMKAAEFAKLADEVPTRREHFQRMAHTSELLAKNSEYLRSWDEFLKELQKQSALIETRIQAAATYPSRFNPCARVYEHLSPENPGQLGGRLGYGFDNLLVYGTDGWAWGHGTSTNQVTCLGPGRLGTSLLTPTSPTPLSIDVNPNGWTAGGGVEWTFLPNRTLRAEYLHLQFDRTTEDRGIIGFVLPVTVTTHVVADTSVDLVCVDVNYLFNWGPRY